MDSSLVCRINLARKIQLKSDQSNKQTIRETIWFSLPLQSIGPSTAQSSEETTSHLCPFYSSILYPHIISFSSYNGYKLNSHLTCFQRGFIAQLVGPQIFWAFFATAQLRRSLSLLLYSLCASSQSQVWKNNFYSARLRRLAMKGTFQASRGQTEQSEVGLKCRMKYSLWSYHSLLTWWL